MKRMLDNGLILRSLSEGRSSDLENIGQFYEEVFGEAGNTESPFLNLWVRDLASGKHPTTTLDDIWVVVDPTQNDRIASALLLIPQTWRIDDVEFGVGRVELVATDKAYRRKGLIRALMNAAHERSAQLGHLVQGITGIPFYYRQFGYAFALELGARSALNLEAVPDLAEGETPKFTLRPATDADIPDLVRWSDYYSQQTYMNVVWTPEIWHYHLNERSKRAVQFTHTLIIQNQQGEGVGFLAVRTAEKSKFYALYSYVVGEESSYMDTLDDVVRGLKSFAKEFYADKPDVYPTRFAFESGITPIVDLMLNNMPSGVVRTTNVYAWYIRVPDLPAFLWKIAPVLERRLGGSGANRYTGELKLSFFDDMTGLTMKFEQGKITEITHGAMTLDDAHGGFSFDMFINVLFGHRSVDEIQYILPETWANRNAQVLLNALFPVKRSWLNGIA